MSSSDLKGATRLDQHFQDAEDALRLAESSLPSKTPKSPNTSFADFDLKSRDSKYKRWLPKMDLYLIKLLLDVVHLFPKGVEPEMSKKAWAYVTGHLRAANPETVYSTYTKYSCRQHLYNVNHARYRVWYTLMMHQKTLSGRLYTYQWNADLGKFQIFDSIESADPQLIHDERQIKLLIYSDGILLPALSQYNKANLIVNDFFLTDSLGYISTYHNEILPLLQKLDSAYFEGLENVYSEIPRFSYPDGNRDFFKPLVAAKGRPLGPGDVKKRPIEVRNEHIFIADGPRGPAEIHVDELVDPMLKRPRNSQDNGGVNADYENALATAAIAAIDSPAVSNGREAPVYLKERKWFNRLMALHNSQMVSAEEVLTVCEGVRDGKIPLFMLNILDSSYYQGEGTEDIEEELLAQETVKRLRLFMLPMTYSTVQ